MRGEIKFKKKSNVVKITYFKFKMAHYVSIEKFWKCMENNDFFNLNHFITNLTLKSVLSKDTLFVN